MARRTKLKTKPRNFADNTMLERALRNIPLQNDFGFIEPQYYPGNAGIEKMKDYYANRQPALEVPLTEINRPSLENSLEVLPPPPPPPPLMPEIPSAAREDIIQAILRALTVIEKPQLRRMDEENVPTPEQMTEYIAPRTQSQQVPSYSQSAPSEGTVVPETPPHLISTIVKAASENGVPSTMLSALLSQESGFDPNAKSEVGAIGIAQFMPDTALYYGVNPLDPISSIKGAARYLKDLYNQFGRWDHALAGYNAGAGNVNKYGGIPPFTETQNFVAKILGAVQNVTNKPFAPGTFPQPTLVPQAQATTKAPQIDPEILLRSGGFKPVSPSIPASIASVLGATSPTGTMPSFQSGTPTPTPTPTPPPYPVVADPFLSRNIVSPIPNPVLFPNLPQIRNIQDVVSQRPIANVPGVQTPPNAPIRLDFSTPPISAFSARLAPPPIPQAAYVTQPGRVPQPTRSFTPAPRGFTPTPTPRISAPSAQLRSSVSPRPSQPKQASFNPINTVVNAIKNLFGRR